MKTALVVMAAGIGSRFGAGIKQLMPVGVNGEIIMDYSIHDAIEAGFKKIIFVIRKDIEEEFHEVIGQRIEKVCAGCGVEVAYAFQSLDEIPASKNKDWFLKNRTKPWGTGQAVLAAKHLIHEPFAVINADDYYGKTAFVKLQQFLSKEQTGAYDCCMAGFVLKNTLSDNGGVTRGLCMVDEAGYLTDVVETKNICKVDGKIMSGDQSFDPDRIVSMNMWGFPESFVEKLDEGFYDFFADQAPEEVLKSEFLLPIYLGSLLEKQQATVCVLQTEDKWFGVTYQEDREIVVEKMAELYRAGVYQNDLFSDL